MRPFHSYPPSTPGISSRGQNFQNKVRDFGQPEKVYAALDKFLELETQTQTYKMTTVAMILMAFPVAVSMATNAVTTSVTCMTGSEDFSSHTCGTAAGSLGGAAIGLSGVALAFWNLRTHASNFRSKIKDLDEELFSKLDRRTDPNVDLNDKLITEYSELSAADKKEIRDDLRADVNAITYPR